MKVKTLLCDDHVKVVVKHQDNVIIAVTKDGFVKGLFITFSEDHQEEGREIELDARVVKRVMTFISKRLRYLALTLKEV